MCVLQEYNAKKQRPGFTVFDSDETTAKTPVLNKGQLQVLFHILIWSAIIYFSTGHNLR